MGINYVLFFKIIALNILETRSFMTSLKIKINFTFDYAPEHSSTASNVLHTKENGISSLFSNGLSFKALKFLSVIFRTFEALGIFYSLHLILIISSD